MSLVVRTTPEVDAQIREIDQRWREHRPGSPDLFHQELTHSFDLVGRMPLIERPYRRSPVAGIRRVLLERTHYHVYYLVGPQDVRVLAAWHARRGLGPPLRK